MEGSSSCNVTVRNEEKEARNKVVSDNLGLVWSIVHRFRNRGYDPEELFQIGSIGLIKAVDRFDGEYGVQFSTYAVPLIIGEIKRFMRDDSMLHVARSIKENAIQVRAVIEKLSKELGREPNLDEVAEQMKLDREEIAVALSSSCEVESIYKTVYEKDGKSISLIEHVNPEDQKGMAPEDVVDRILLENSLHQLLNEEQEFIRMRYYEDMTQNQIAAILKISQVQVSRMEKKILKKLKTCMDG